MAMSKMVAAAFVLAAASAAGCSTNPYAVAPTTSGAMCVLKPFITNPDGSLTREQMQAGVSSGFRAADVNGNGNLEYSELISLNEARAQTCDQTPLTDWSGTGKVGAKEYGARYVTNFNEADTDKDGIATYNEILFAERKPPKVDRGPMKPDSSTQTGGGMEPSSPY